MHGGRLSALRELLVLNNQKRTYLIVIPETMKQYSSENDFKPQYSES